MPPRASSALLVTLAASTIACGREEKQPKSEPSTAQTKAAAPTSTGSAPAVAASSIVPPAPQARRVSPSGAFHSLYVGGAQGVREVALDGNPKRVVSKTPAEKPRLLPDGKALVFLANEHRELKKLFLNRKTGDLIPIREGAAPAPLTGAELAKLDAVPTYDAVGETRIDWLPTAHALLVDHLLFVPGKAPVDLGGDVAPW